MECPPGVPGAGVGGRGRKQLCQRGEAERSRRYVFLLRAAGVDGQTDGWGGCSRGEGEKETARGKKV